ncbi:FKBP-type peptidyl-prolyl cis-trans isomerase [Turneriella parva]|nr:FKBP-type peptidyl-prolyl cis-trans isomerase [Turneriella parva]
MTKSDGLEYEVVKEGKGQAVISGQRVQVHYTGWLNAGGGKKGKVFDSSRKKNRPFVFALGEGHVIRGWDEGVAGMKRGEKRILYVPAMLGYGPRGAGDAIPPNSDLIFEVELLDFE